MRKAVTSSKAVQRLLRAPVDPMPELAKSLAPFTVTCTQWPSARMLERCRTGLLTEHRNQNSDTFARVVLAVGEQKLHHLVSDMAWDAAALNRQRVQTTTALPTEGDGVLTFDEPGFRKQGQASAGAQRQYFGTVAKTGNCQVAVTCHCHVPDAIPLLTKPAITRPGDGDLPVGRRDFLHIGPSDEQRSYVARGDPCSSNSSKICVSVGPFLSQGVNMAARYRAHASEAMSAASKLALMSWNASGRR